MKPRQQPVFFSGPLLFFFIAGVWILGGGNEGLCPTHDLIIFFSVFFNQNASNSDLSKTTHVEMKHFQKKVIFPFFFVQKKNLHGLVEKT